MQVKVKISEFSPLLLLSLVYTYYIQYLVDHKKVDHLVSSHYTIVRNCVKVWWKSFQLQASAAIGWKITRISQVVWRYEGRKQDVLGLSHILILMRVCKVIGVQTTLIHFVEELIYRLVQQTSIYSMYNVPFTWVCTYLLNEQPKSLCPALSQVR